MSEVKTRKVHTPEFKAKVGLEALRGMKTINEIGQEHGVHPVQVGQWKKAIQEHRPRPCSRASAVPKRLPRIGSRSCCTARSAS